MITLGIDSGSLTTKAIVLIDNNIAGKCVLPTGEDGETSARSAVSNCLTQLNLNPENMNSIPVVATGIGAKSLTFVSQHKAITTCLARGIRYMLPQVRMIIDMGAESSTVIKINDRGRIVDWANHDKCASGTGLFLQQMAKLMAISIEEMSTISFKAKSRPEITSTCAVFAESEVISHIHRIPPTPMPDVVAGIYCSVASRILALCKRVGIEKEVAVTGGVALNRGLINIIEEEMGFKVLIPENPQLVAALGAAIIAGESAEKGIYR